MDIVSRIRRHRRGVTGAIIAAAVIATLALPASAATPRQVSGFWSGTDIDGSTQYLVVTRRLNAFYLDDGASVCLDAFGEFSVATFSGPGTITGDTLSVTADLTCWLSTGPQVVFEDLVIDFDWAEGATERRRDDTLTDLNGCTLVHRRGPASTCP